MIELLARSESAFWVIRANTAVRFKDQTVTVTWKPSGWSQELADEIVDALDKGLPCTADAKFLLAVLVRWDLLDDDGNPVPIEESVIGHLPCTYFQQLRRRW